MKIKPILFFLALLYHLPIYSQGNWTTYTTEFIINDVLIDGDDMWVGSQGGLTRTNLESGEFQTFLASNSPITGGEINELEKAPDGSLWIGSNNSGVYNYINGEWVHYYDGIVSDEYRSIKNLQILPNGDVWFFVQRLGSSVRHRLIRIRNGVVQTFSSLPVSQSHFCVSDENTIYMTYNRTIFKYDVTQSQVIESYHASNSIISSDDNFYEILTDKNGTIIIPSETRILQIKNGLLSVLSDIGSYTIGSFKDENDNIYLHTYNNDPDGFRLIKYDGTTTTFFKDEDLGSYPLEGIYPRFYAADNLGGFFAAFYSYDLEFLLYKFDGTVWTELKNQISPMHSNYQYDVQSDCHGNLWFTCYNGVDVRYADGSWENFRIEADKHLLSAHDMTVHPLTCDVWFSNSGNSWDSASPGVIRISNGELTQFLLDHDNVYDIEASIDGKVYFYSSRSGFGYIENDEVFLIEEFEQNSSIYSIDIDSKGNVYLASWELGLVKYDGEYFNYLGTGEGSDKAYRVMVDNDDFVWVTTPNGLMQFDGLNWTSYEFPWTDISITGLAQDKKGNYWISTFSEGLFYWDKETIQNYNIHNSDLTIDNIYNVSLDPNDNLIVTQSVGVSVLNIPKLQRSFKGTGSVFYDADKNGLYDEPDDVLVPSQKIRDLDNDIWAVTNLDGEYSFYSDVSSENNYIHNLEEGAESTTDNIQTAALIDNQSILPDFGFWKESEIDIQVTVTNGVPVCNRQFNVYINLYNKSLENIESSNSFYLAFSSSLSFIESSYPSNLTLDNLLVFDDISLKPFEGKRVRVTFEAPGIEEEETSLNFDVSLEIPGQQIIGNANDIVLCSYDPNDKNVKATGPYKNEFSLIEDALAYTIRFQNEGTYKAFDVTIIDTLESSLDPSTFELIASSHRVEASITGDGIISFVFADIDLPHTEEDEAGSQGFVSFSVKPFADTENFTMINNKASIYFDFNPPIVTNTTEWNVVDDLALVATHELQSNIFVSPNPTSGKINIQVDAKSIFRILDIQGQLISNGNLILGPNYLDLNVNSGIYILQVVDETNRVSSKKIVVF